MEAPGLRHRRAGSIVAWVTSAAAGKAALVPHHQQPWSILACLKLAAVGMVERAPLRPPPMAGRKFRWIADRASLGPSKIVMAPTE